MRKDAIVKVVAVEAVSTYQTKVANCGCCYDRFGGIERYLLSCAADLAAMPDDRCDAQRDGPCPSAAASGKLPVG